MVTLQRGLVENTVFSSSEQDSEDFDLGDRFGHRGDERLCSNGHTIPHDSTLFHTVFPLSPSCSRLCAHLTE